MKQSRRKFIQGSGAALVGGALGRASAEPGDNNQAPDITANLAAAGFNPHSANSTLLAIIGDLHINLDANDPKFTDRFDDALVNELNQLTPAVSELVVAGDLIVHHSVSIGGERYPSHYELSRLEFRRTKEQLGRFRESMTVSAVPGNHDTDRYETDAQLWREELQLPPYQKRVLGGVPVFLLNSGQAGLPDASQQAWFEREVALIPAGQEVVIIAHHPSFYSLYEEIGLKRIVAKAFARHQAPVWLVGGHGHGFAEQLYVSGSARFIQMEVTTGNRVQWSDNRAPGYVLMALQNGKMVHRMFRCVSEPGFQSLKPANELVRHPLVFYPETIEAPAAFHEEGLYDRSGRLIHFVGIDLRSHLVTCRIHVVRVDLSQTKGKVVDYVIAAHVWNGYAPPSCDFSASGPNGPWTTVSFPAQTGQRVYRIPIPAEFRAAPSLYIRTRTQLQGSWDGLSVYGWGLAGSAASLTGYEKWLVTHYRTFLETDQTTPTRIPPGSRMTNIEHYVFNIPLPAATSSGVMETLPPGAQVPILGIPAYSRSFRRVISFQFARRVAESNPAVTYRVEFSADLKRWTTAAEDQLAVTRLNSDWEEVRLNQPMPDGSSAYFRVAISSKQGSGSIISAGDHNGDGIDDLVAYAFDLQASNGLARAYDPDRIEQVAGIPLQKQYQGLCSTLRYARPKNQSASGVNCRIEATADLKQWTTVPSRFITERIIRSNDEWEEVEAILMDSMYQSRFYRVCLDLAEPLAK